MSTDDERSPGPGGWLPGRISDLALVVAATAAGALAPAIQYPPVRRAAGLPLVCFLPGYAATAALFPRRADSDRVLLQCSSVTARVGLGSGPDGGESTADRGPGLGPVERVVLSVVLSVSLVILLGAALLALPVAFGSTALVAVLGGTTVAAAGLAALRRRAQPPAVRYSPEPVAAVLGLVGRLRRPPTRVDAVLDALLVVAVALALATLVGAGAAPTGPGADDSSGTGFTELYLLAPDGDALTAADYPERLEPGEPEPIVVGVGNEEGESRRYHVVAEVHAGGGEATTGGAGAERERLSEFEVALDDGERHLERLQVRPTVDGDRVRLTVLLYRGDAPPDPSLDDAYRRTTLWFDVGDASDAAPDDGS